MRGEIHLVCVQIESNIKINNQTETWRELGERDGTGQNGKGIAGSDQINGPHIRFRQRRHRSSSWKEAVIVIQKVRVRVFTANSSMRRSLYSTVK